MFRFIWLSFLGQPRKHLSVALIFGIDLAQPPTEHIFQMYLVWSFKVATVKSVCLITDFFSENFVFFMHFILMFLSYFRTKLRKKIIFPTKILCFIYFLCIGIDLVPQKTLISKVHFKFCKNNPGPQADTASYLFTKTFSHYLGLVS